jgi:hypothetical protein
MPSQPTTTKYEAVLSCYDAFNYNTVIPPLLFICSADLPALHHLTTMHDDWFLLTDIPMMQLRKRHILPTYLEALGNIVTTVRDSVIVFSAIWGDEVAQFMYSCLQPVEGRLGFEMTVHRVYVVLGFWSFLR